MILLPSFALAAELRAGAPQPDTALPPGATARLGTGLVAWHHPAESLVVLPDGTVLAAGGYHGPVVAWDPKTWIPREIRPGDPDRSVQALARAADGRLAVAYADAIALTGAGAPLELPLPEGYGALTSLAFSPDGRRLYVAAWEQPVWYYALPDPTPIEVPETTGRDAALSPDGQRLAVLSGWGVTIREATSGALVADLAELGSPYDVAWSPDGARLAVDDHVGLVLFDVVAGKELGRTDWVRTATGGGDADGLAWSPDGAWVAADLLGNGACVYDGRTATRRWCADGDLRLTDTEDGIAFSPDGGIVYEAGGHGEPQRWDAATGAPIASPYVRHDHAIEAVAVTSRHVATLGRAIRVWDAATGAPRCTILGERPEMLAAAGEQLVFVDTETRPRDDGGYDTTTFIAVADTSCAVSRRIPIPASPRLLAATAHVVATAGEDGAIAAYDLRTGQATLALPADGRDLLEGLAVSADGTRVAVVDPGEDVRIFEATTGKVLATWSAEEPYLREVAFAGTDVLLVGDGDVQLRSAAGEVLKASTVEWPFGTRFLAADARGRFVVARDDGAELWDARTGERVRAFTGHGGAVRSAAFDPAGARLVTGSADTTGLVWEVAEQDPG